MADPSRTGARPTGVALMLAAARHTRGRITLLTVLLCARTGITLAVPALLAAAVNAVLSGSDVTRPALAWAAVVATGAVCDVLMAPLGASCAALGGRWLRLRTVRHLLGLGARRSGPDGESVTQVTQAAAQAGSTPVVFAQWAVTLTGSLAAFCWLWFADWRSALAFTLAVPVTVLIARRFIGRVADTHSAYLAVQGRIANLLLTALSGARTIRASGTLTAETTRVLTPLPDLTAAGRRMWRLQRGTVWQLGLLLSLTEALVLGVAGFAVSDGRLAPGDFLAVAGYLALALQAVSQIDGLLALAQARAAADRVADVLARPAMAYGHRDTGEPARENGAGALSLRKVTVRDGERTLLDGVDLDVPAGTAVALVGRSGAGKSLLAGLPGRFTDPDEGDVLLDGVPVRELSAPRLRTAVTYAFERPVLIGTTVRDALSYGRPELPRRTVEDAARAAHADAFVRRLPDGYDTPLTATPLSGGERQRLGLARTLARPARVYVLDDATSGLDTVTEAQVSTAVTQALAGRTRLVVAHRVATAARCDLVVWLADGRVRGVAPHAVLWQDPDYRAVFAATEEAPA
ncbi:ABC transporter ATP-binding protein [Streptomyces sp. DSM 41972]|uniref:ABC transporter ATP-binding protein n=1 Tax=Streptomyces althioticus subsp. attaecolombicae TaxID=3075534 RepID=A0ABU3I3W1_9ACTN|nr:ABC transporter ATP-binding protein [Streptomyces sp. DSM 41972]SCD41368.1 ATP-binding cassette, subfamily B [Streptomyces sp. di188]SCD48561.1 ATP-binding cassette, subfamily B [Streptomyces sp. di50b]